MSTPPSEKPERSERPARTRVNEPGTYQAGELVSDQGKTAVADTVVARLAKLIRDGADEILAEARRAQAAVDGIQP